MKHHDLIHAVARATGETPETIARRGFSLVRPVDALWVQTALESCRLARRLRRGLGPRAVSNARCPSLPRSPSQGARSCR